MATVRDSEPSLWLHNKLGTSNDLWSGGSICSQLNQDVLRNIRGCFMDLQSQVKLKLLLSFLHIPRRNVEEWKIELEEILEVALVDSDQWVSMLAELLKSYPSSGLLNFNIEENGSVFTDVVNDLKKLIRKHSDQTMLPQECLYLNKTALTAVVGQLPPTVSHFLLKQKPKSATLRAELVQKSLDAANNTKKNSTTPSVPIRCRGLIKTLNDPTPLRGIPSRVNAGGFKNSGSLGRLAATPPSSRIASRTPSGRKEGRVKFLEIEDQPMGYGRDAKRRKKPTEMETPELRKDKEGAQPQVATIPATPDYAAGLLTQTQIPTPSVAAITPGPTTPNYAPNPVTPSASITPALPASTSPAKTIPFTPSLTLPAPDPNYSPQPQPPQPEPKPQPQQQQVIHTALTNLTSNMQLQQLMQQTQLQQAQLQQRQAQLQQQQRQVQLQQQQQQLQLQQQQQQQQQHIIVRQQPQTQQQVHTLVQMMQPQQQQVVQPQAPAKKSLYLTKEQMQEAQAMFDRSNKVTRPEKALILGFIAGSRENPCPHLGQIVTIMLSENEEKVQMQDGSIQTMIVETHFQMNYSNGEWKKVCKYRKQVA